MEYSPKYVARVVGSYFLCLVATNIFVHATFMQVAPEDFSSTMATSIVNPQVLLMEDEHAAISFIPVQEEPIVIDHHDITGLKRIVLSKRKRNARKNQPRTSRPRFVPAARIKSVPVAYNALFDSLNVSDDVRASVIEEAKKYLGLKYRWGGTTPKGFDCSGFTSYVLAQQGVGIARSSRYQARQGQDIDLSNTQTGDLIFFSKYGKGGRVTHVAMVVANKEDGVYVIHATRRGIVVDNLSESSYWKPKTLYAKDVITKS